MKVRKLDKSYHIYGRFQPMCSFKYLIITVLFLAYETAYASGEAQTDFIRSIGKIYVVAGVCLVILIALFVYMYQIDRKISRLEKRYKNE